MSNTSFKQKKIIQKIVSVWAFVINFSMIIVKIKAKAANDVITKANRANDIITTAKPANDVNIIANLAIDVSV